ncbi:MAG: 3-phosphoglycerate dehydrogenase [Clostridia bacterium]|nr:3-phosphoglycerate dehydrogenase [Clostridia bacterium]
MKIATLNKISEIGLKELKPSYEITGEIAGAAGVLVRSAAMHDMEFPRELHAIARAGAGVNNIPLDKCSEEGIVVFNTPGANANAVKELVIAGLLMSSRDLIGGNAWAKTLTEDVAKAVEKGKGMFAGVEIAGKTLGVVGLGAIGAKVANTALDLGMKVIGYDPFISIDGAWRISKNVVHATDLKQIYENCDYITIHVPLTPDTKGFINKETISQMKQGVVILNYARAGLVADEDIKAALSSGKVRRYVTDFPDGDIASYPGVIAFPHLGASTEESEENCAYMAAIQLKDYLENGNIKNSVNYPEMNSPRAPGQKRVVVLHKNIPAMLSQISGEFSKLSLNIDNMQNRSKKEYACTVLDVSCEIPESAQASLEAIDGVIRVRILD